MPDEKTSGVRYDADGEARLRTFLETDLGCKVRKLDRQVYWRPAWFAEVERNGEEMELYLRGQREGEVAVFPELRREGVVVDLLFKGGVPVSEVLGFCEDPEVIIMRRMRGERDVSTLTEAQKAKIGRDYMAALAKMHALPLEPFMAKGFDVPRTAEDIAMAGVNAYLPLYNRTKAKPEPMLEFTMQWIRRNVPQNRTTPAFVQFDSGQFLHHDGEMSGLFDFEVAMIGDPMMDFATIRLRDSFEPLGSELKTLCAHYEEFSGQKIDHRVVDFYTLIFATVSTMQFSGTVAKPKPGDPHDTYLMFDIALRQDILLGFEAMTGVKFAPQTLPDLPPGPNAVLHEKLGNSLENMETGTPMGAAQKETLQNILEWTRQADRYGAYLTERDLAETNALLGWSHTDWPTAEAELEKFVMGSGAEWDARLMQLFADMENRHLAVFGGTKLGFAATQVTFPPTC